MELEEYTTILSKNKIMDQNQVCEVICVNEEPYKLSFITFIINSQRTGLFQVGKAKPALFSCRK